MADHDNSIERVDSQEALEILFIRPFRDLSGRIDFWQDRRVPSHEEQQLARGFTFARRCIEQIPQSESTDKQRAIDSLVDSWEQVREMLHEGIQMAASGEGERAANRCRRLVDLVPWPSVHTELGSLFLRGAGHEPLTAFDFKDQEFERSDPADEFELMLEAPAGDFHEDAQELAGAVGQAEMKRLALEAYVPAYGYYIRALVREELRARDVIGMYLTLDGLRLLLTEMGSLDLAGLICEAYFGLHEVHGFPVNWWDTLDTAPNPFERRFGETRGYIDGKNAERAVVEAESLSVIRANESQARELAVLMAQELTRVPPETVRSQEQELRRELGSSWEKLPRPIQSLLAQADYLRKKAHPADFDWSPIAIQYSKALEETLRRTLGVRLDSFLAGEGRLGKMFADDHIRRYRAAEPKAADLILEDFGRFLERAVHQPLFSKFLDSTYGETAHYFKSLALEVNSFVRTYRNRAAHGPEPIAGAAVSEMRRILLEPTDGRPGLILLLTSC